MTAILAPSRTPLRLGDYGKDVQAARISFLELLGRPAPTAPEKVQRTFGLGMRQLVKDAQDDLLVARSGVIGPATIRELNDADEADGGRLIPAKADALFAQAFVEFSRPDRKVPDLGPVQPGGRSLLDEALTHATSGIPRFPAFDTAWGGGGGVTVIAPEACEVDTKDTSSSPGDAIYTTGVSLIRYWVGHLDRDWPLGHRFKKGDLIGMTLPIPGKSDHAHWGVNVEALFGKGKQLLYGETGHGPDYTRGSPTVGQQLRKWAAG